MKKSKEVTKEVLVSLAEKFSVMIKEIRMVSRLYTKVAKARRVFFNTPSDDSEAREKALELWISSCTTVFQVKEAFSYTIPGSKMQKKALGKWEKLTLAAVEKSCNLAKAKRVWENAPDNTVAKKRAFLKVLDLWH